MSWQDLVEGRKDRFRLGRALQPTGLRVPNQAVSPTRPGCGKNRHTRPSFAAQLGPAVKAGIRPRAAFTLWQAGEMLRVPSTAWGKLLAVWIKTEAAFEDQNYSRQKSSRA